MDRVTQGTGHRRERFDRMQAAGIIALVVTGSGAPFWVLLLILL